MKRYYPGGLFGERALPENKPRGATVTAVAEGAHVTSPHNGAHTTRVWALSRGAFEAKLGSLSQLQAEQCAAAL